jgi:hypothetical protein
MQVYFGELGSLALRDRHTLRKAKHLLCRSVALAVTESSNFGNNFMANYCCFHSKDVLVVEISVGHY